MLCSTDIYFWNRDSVTSLDVVEHSFELSGRSIEVRSVWSDGANAMEGEKTFTYS